MEGAILLVIKQHNKHGVRIREIAHLLNLSNVEVSDILHQFLKDGFVKRTYVHHPENSEYYDLWYLSK